MPSDLRVLANPRVHGDRRSGTNIDGASGAELRDGDEPIAHLSGFWTESGALLPEEQDAVDRQLKCLQGDRALDVVESQNHQALRFGPRAKHGRVDVMVNVLVAISHHGPAAVPALATHDVDLAGQKGVGGPDDGSNIEVVLQILNGHMEGMPTRIELGHDCVKSPIAKLVNDIASVALSQQGLIQARVHRPRLGMWANSYRRIMEIHARDDSLPR